MVYAFRCEETRVYLVDYEVEARNMAEAIDKCEKGETLSETEVRLLSVINREAGYML